jgi:hypothetical protein
MVTLSTPGKVVGIFVLVLLLKKSRYLMPCHVSYNGDHSFHSGEESVRVLSGNLLEFIDACLDSTPSLIAKVYSDQAAWTRQMKVLKFHCHAYGGCAECGILNKADIR